ncbi:Ig-like domain-containing protein [Mammaliicoccus sciuri]|uniref:SpaA isopeptide-forming pilin-related protein n=1 Tax=Mammaliicoccus sciuri TaxID=1296 RepID=UPI0021D007AB|nr:SpaA isopeptide-forming pilin-related protein [Mammaliicoccus sciuri]UXU84117.1 Ig-like domain-containing protein [Mammaliicoccus sciuri]UXU93966.1 Ig-like domain-containing protein [Mammaliicoccus sciuri]UXV15915.1 Ig-like domain-containing protein [Mammaliicoccus sciuri]UXV24175.1 Ig-like domain-containing protein [Mammaliicoccus sciuri]UXV26958.1 Ig-like domain-containing protein [Mammaliicoccus sciuri]
MRKVSILIMFLLVFTQIFSFNNQVQAKDLTNNVIKDINVTKQDGSNGEFSHRERTKISVTFAENGTKISPNDTLSVLLPKELLGFNSAISLKNSEGTELGTCQVSNNSVDCTFNDNVEKLDNIRGEFFFEAEINKSEEGSHKVDLDFGNTNITKVITVNNGSSAGGKSEEIFHKSGQILPDDVNNIQWAIRFNNKQDYFRGNDPALISDNIGSGMELNKDSLQLSVKQVNEAQPRFYTVEEFENAGLGNVDVTNKTINIRFNTPSYNELIVYYSTKITDNSLKSFENQSSVTYIDKNERQIIEHSNAVVQNINSGGKAEGDLAKYSGKVVISKVGNDEKGNSKPLEGAEFELVNLDGEVVGKGTTDSNGTLVFENIKGGTHTLKETKIPDGYKINEADFPSKVVLDFEKDKEINLTVVNIKDPEPDNPTPDPDKPDPDKPDPDNPTPDNPKPDEPKPDNPKPDKPDPDNPTPDKPDPDKPDPDKPEPDKPDPDKPEPDNPKPDNPKPDEPKPDNPKPDNPTPDNPKPDNPKPDNPTPDNPKPDNPKPDNPKPDNPKPDNPKPDNPKPDNPTPDNPKPDEPEPDKPEPDKPNPDKPDPDKPDPDKPDPDKPDPDKPEPDNPTPDKPEPDKPDPDKPEPDKPEPDNPKPDNPKPDNPKPDNPKPDKPEPDNPKPDEPTHEKPTPEAQNKEETNTGKSSEENINRDQAKNNTQKDGNMTATSDKTQQKNDKDGILPNTGEVIQNHPIITTASILLLLAIGSVLLFFRKKQK